MTAEDVAASLYYLHLNTEDDNRFLEGDNEIITEEPEPMQQKALPRKPVPGSGRTSLDVDRSTEPTNFPNRMASVPKRKPLASESFPVNAHPPQFSGSPVVRRPLGPRSLATDVTVKANPLPGLENIRIGAGSRPLSPLKTDGLPGQNLGSAVVEVSKAHRNDFLITLIRRDPSSGAQWNVGTIFGQPAQDEAQTRRGKASKKPYFDISVHLTTPGYNYFRKNASATGYSAGGMTDAMPMGVSRAAERSPVQHRSDSGFTRQVRMEGSSFWDRPSMHKRTPSDWSAERASPRANEFGRDALLEANSNLSGNDSTTSGSDFRSKGYIFESPWGGWCKFSTGSGGRTLRCKHNLPAPISAKTAGDFTSTPQPPSTVSELRFNLPSSSIFTPSTDAAKRSSVDTGRFNISKLNHIRNKLSHDKTSSTSRPPLPPRPHPTSYAAMYPSDDEERPPLPPRSPASSAPRPEAQQTASFFSPDAARSDPDLSSDDRDGDDRLDLSIGREKAGGGNRGKRAKLGKLIIHDEGFKMLDLAVAANMAIWWSVWEFDNR